MKIITANLNGIRSAISKGFNECIEHLSPDVVCIQETKAQILQMQGLTPKGYSCFFSDAEKKGYSGVGIYSKKAPNSVHEYGDQIFDSEGRYLEAHFDKLIIISIYLPSGTTGQVRQDYKMQCLKRFYQDKLVTLISENKSVIICGDFNIAHKKLDLKNWRTNQKNSGFLPEERKWFDEMLELGWTDSFRKVHPNKEQYTWWTYRSAARSRNVGWRIDYQICSRPDLVLDAKVIDNPVISDHAPLIITYDL